MENRRSEDDEIPRGMWEAVETGARKVGVEKTEERRSKRRSWKEERKRIRRRDKKRGGQWR